MSKIRNINGTSDNNEYCKCGSWIKHWNKYVETRLPGKCIVVGCKNDDVVGAHVKKVDSQDDDWYIASLCRGHNNASSEDVLDIYSFKLLAPASREGTCGY